MKSMRSLLIAGLVAGAAVSPVHAKLDAVSTSPNSALFTGGVLSAGPGPSIINAPAYALDSFAANTSMQGFDEAQGVVTTKAYAVDGGIIAAGTRVDSHMIFLNSSGPTAIVHLNVVWTFSGTILGVMSDNYGTLEATSTFELGSSSTRYEDFSGAGDGPPFLGRGFESEEFQFSVGGTEYKVQDGYAINGNQLTVTMAVTEPGDWIRVVTVSPVPEPEIYAMMMAGLGLLGFMGRRKKTSQACLAA